jgi:hypothetical protein
MQPASPLVEGITQAMGCTCVSRKPEGLTYHAPVAGMPGVDVFRAVYQRHSFARHSHDSLALGVLERVRQAFS